MSIFVRAMPLAVLITVGSMVHARVVITDAPAATQSQGNTQFSPDSISPLQRSQAEMPLVAGKIIAAPPKRVSAQIQHGLQLLHGLQGPLDIKQAGYTFMLAYSRGDAQAATAVAYCTLLGCYGVADQRSVALWIERARVREPAKAKLLEWASAEQWSTRLPRDRAPALLREAGALLDPVALNEQGLLQLTAGQRALALKRFELAAQRGSVAAARNLNLLLQQLDGSQSLSSSGQAGAAALSVPSAPGELLYEQAKRYHIGQEVPVNDVQAIELYRQAANLGHQRSKRMLDLIFVRRSAQGGVDSVWMRSLAQQYLGTGSLETQPTAVWLQKDISLLADWLPLN